MDNEYIIAIRNDHYTIIGPFADVDAMRHWADVHWTLDHDPRWQSITLVDPHATPRVIDPFDPAAVAAIRE